MAINELVAAYASTAREADDQPRAGGAPEQGPAFAHDLPLPNEHEAAALSGVPIRTEGGLHTEDIAAVAEIMRSREPSTCWLRWVKTARPSARAGRSSTFQRAGRPRADPTAAGDSFVAAFCVGMCVGLSHREAIDFARNTAAITVSRMGAQPSLPKLDDVLGAMAAHAEAGFPFDKLDCLR
jgi:ribokinase